MKTNPRSSNSICDDTVSRLNEALRSFLEVNNLKQDYILYYLPFTDEDPTLAFHISRDRIYHQINIESLLNDFSRSPYDSATEIISFDTDENIMECLDNVEKILMALSTEGTHYTFVLIPRFDPENRELIHVVTSLTWGWEKLKESFNHEVPVLEFYLWNIFYRFATKFSCN